MVYKFLEDQFDLFDNVNYVQFVKKNGTEQIHTAERIRYTAENRTGQMHRVIMEQNSLQETVHQVMDSISQRIERPWWTT